MKKEKSIKKNYIFNMLYQILIIIIPLITTPYVARILMPEGVGQYSYSLSIISYFTIFASLGFGYYAQREIAKHRENNHDQTIAFWEIIICRLIPVSLSLLVNVILICTNVYHGYSLLMIILCVNIVATAFDIAFYFQGNEEFGKMVLINTIIKVLGTASIFIFVKTPNDVWKYTLIHSLVLIISNLAMWPFLHKRIEKVNIKELRPLKHLPGTIRLFLPNLAVSLYTVLDKSLLGFITHDDSQNGFYEQAEKIVKTAMTVVLALGPVMISRNSYEISQGNTNKVRENNYRAIHFVWLLGVPMMLGLIAVADNMVPWFLGQNFGYSSLLIKVLAPLVLIIGMSNVIGLQYMIPNKMDRRFTIAISCGAIINLICNIPFIYLWKSFGAAIATIIAELTVTIIMIVMARKHIDVKEMLKTAIKPAIAGLVMFACLYPMQMFLSPSVLHTLLIVFAGILIYGVVIILLKDKLIIEYLHGIKNKLFKRKNSNTDKSKQKDEDITTDNLEIKTIEENDSISNDDKGE